VDDGGTVHALVRPSSKCDQLPGEVVCHVYDGSTASVLRALEAAAPEAAFHLAAQVVPRNPDALEDIFEANLLLGAQLLEGLGRGSSPALVNAGSFWQFDSEGKADPNTLYAATKRSFQTLIDYYARTRGLRAVTVILFDVYGPEDTRDKLLPTLLPHLGTGRRFPMTAGDQKMDLVHADDVVRGMVQAARTARRLESPGHRVYALDSGRRVTVRELVRLLEALSGESLDAGWGDLDYRPDTIFEPVRGMERLSGWKTSIDLEAGLRGVLPPHRRRANHGC
jgi:nucleoside-diphosphate-sugar epimerase